ncbi:hypothetical protein BHE74_00004359 [Ensete ventricosum]|nr:hypothetical protein BHE74_00004359 [Ensete ventricosum]
MTSASTTRASISGSYFHKRWIFPMVSIMDFDSTTMKCRRRCRAMKGSLDNYIGVDASGVIVCTTDVAGASESARSITSLPCDGTCLEVTAEDKAGDRSLPPFHPPSVTCLTHTQKKKGPLD